MLGVIWKSTNAWPHCKTVLVFKVDRRTKLLDKNKGIFAFMVDEYGHTVMDLNKVPGSLLATLDVVHPF